MVNGILQKIENNEQITKHTQPEFWYRVQKVLLLALQEQGILSFTACRRAEESLSLQHHGRIQT